MCPMVLLALRMRSPVTKRLSNRTFVCVHCVSVCDRVCGLTFHGLSCLDELRHTCRHMPGVHGQLLLLLGRGPVQRLEHRSPPTRQPEAQINVL